MLVSGGVRAGFANTPASEVSLPEATLPEATLIDTIVVTAPASPARVQPPRLQLREAALRDRQPMLLADTLRGLPGVSIRPNSRGESVLRIRGSEERQAAVFLDGAPLAVPWDGRVDLGVLPASLIGALSVTKGAVPIEYGTNAIAGVVDLQTRREADTTTAEASAGTLGLRAASALAQWEHGASLETLLAAGTVARDAQAIAERDALPYSQRDDTARSNTDLDSRALFAATGMASGDQLWRLSLLHADIERGIAPEAHLDPATNPPRYWRTPDWRLTQLSLAGETGLGQAARLRAVAWRQWFAQTIEAYRTQDYAALRSRQQDQDRTLGARVTLTHPLGPLALRWSTSAQASTHAQVDTPFPIAVPGPELRYRQRLHSAGVEADWTPTERVRATFGLGVDHAATPLTGDKPAQADQHAPAYSAALAWDWNTQWRMTLSGGRRTRFPSARELFGEALGRFLVNPDLRPETAQLADLELAWRDAGARISLNPFFQRNRDTIAQRVVVVDGRTLRQRINLPGSRAYGVDAYAGLPLRDSLTLEIGATWLRTRVEPSPGFAFDALPQRPRHELFVAADWVGRRGLDLRAEVRDAGGAFDIGADGAAVALRSQPELNLRAAWPLFRVGPDHRAALTVALDNATNAVVEPQLGLPLAGRTWRVGLRLD